MVGLSCAGQLTPQTSDDSSFTALAKTLVNKVKEEATVLSIAATSAFKGKTADANPAQSMPSEARLDSEPIGVADLLEHLPVESVAQKLTDLEAYAPPLHDNNSTGDITTPVAINRLSRRELANGGVGWREARATWYGGPQGPGPDGMSIHTGSCKYGKISNHFISAWQTNGGYDWGLTDKCGQCFEVMCVDGATRGHDWSDLGPWGGCQSSGVKSVIVMISDSCPCHHPNESNKRWCCGDRTHLDLSYAAFDQIALRHRGVVDLKVRPASCSKQGTVNYYE